jgi:alpha-ketoglutarate-dependent taurine dioxygenase
LSAVDVLDVDLSPGRPPVLWVTSALPEGGAPGWVAAHAPGLHDCLIRHGAVLVRGLGVRDAATIARAAEALAGPPMLEREAFARRRPLGNDVVSSLEWPPDQPMCMHHEMGHARELPRLLVIGCLQAPARGGVTGLADAAAALAALPPDLVERFATDGWILDRAYHDLVGMPWRESFAAADRAAAERYAADNDITVRWLPDGGVRTSQHRPAVIRHPVTGERLWCNEVAFLNEWTLDPAVREYLIRQFGDDGLPFNTRHGDGTPIDTATVELVNDVYDQLTVREAWREGDLLLVDNVRMAHSREPYRGRREVGLVLCEPVRLVRADHDRSLV